MFGSISNWVNENVPKPTMPTVNIPTVNMPSMPGFLNKNKDATDEPTAENSSEVVDSSAKVAEETSESEPAKVEDVIVESSEKKSTENTADAANEEVKAPVEGEEPQSENGGYKTLESAKEIGKNMGNMLFSFGSNVRNTTSSLTSKVGEMGSATVSATSSLTSKVGSATANATSSLKDVIQKKTIIGEFNKENEKFVNEKKEKQRREDSAVPPWVGYNEEEKLKEQILALSSDSRNFLRPPPQGVEFQFDFNTAYPIAMTILEEDPALSEMRFKLVPKQVKEENFWLNYFYRVSLIKQSTQLEELTKQEKSSDSKEAPNASKQDTVEFVSDSYENNINDEELKNELKQLKLDSSKKSDDNDGKLF